MRVMANEMLYWGGLGAARRGARSWGVGFGVVRAFCSTASRGFSRPCGSCPLCAMAGCRGCAKLS